jgi:hypothetical protein
MALSKGTCAIPLKRDQAGFKDQMINEASQRMLTSAWQRTTGCGIRQWRAEGRAGLK